MKDHEPIFKPPLFDMGDIVVTPGALAAIQQANQQPHEFLRRHVTGDWAELPDEDRRGNELSLKKGFRILSTYTLATGEKIRIITRVDRALTTILLPWEY